MVPLSKNWLSNYNFRLNQLITGKLLRDFKISTKRKLHRYFGRNFGSNLRLSILIVCFCHVSCVLKKNLHLILWMSWNSFLETGVNLKSNWLQGGSNPKPLRSLTHTQPFSQTVWGFESYCSHLLSLMLFVLHYP